VRSSARWAAKIGFVGRWSENCHNQPCVGPGGMGRCRLLGGVVVEDVDAAVDAAQAQEFYLACEEVVRRLGFVHGRRGE
jgi:hypothetical protein